MHSAILLPWHQTQSTPTLERSLHQPPQGLILTFFSNGKVRVLNCLTQPLQITIASDAIARSTAQGQDGCISSVLSIDERNKTLRLTVCPKMDSFATCRYVWGKLIIHLMPFKHGTAWQICLWCWISSVPLYVCACARVCVCDIYVCLQQYLCLCG